MLEKREGPGWKWYLQIAEVNRHPYAPVLNKVVVRHMFTTQQ